MEAKTATLLDCLSLRADPDRAGRLGLVQPETWAAVLAQAGLHKVAPLLFQRTRALELALPPEVETRLREVYQQNLRRNQLLYLEMGKLLHALQEQNIPAIAFKGLHLAAGVYGSAGSRRIGDIDLLVQPADLQRIETLMLALGCSPLHQHQVIGPDIYDFSYSLPRTAIRVEFHWALIYSKYLFEPDIAGIWERAQPAALSGIHLTVMAPEDLLLYLCLHATKHWFELHLNLLCDIAAVLQHYEAQLDWGAIESRAAAWKSTHSTYLFLRLAQELLGAPLPEARLARLRPAGFQDQYLDLALEQFLAEPVEGVEHFASPFAVVEIAGVRGLGPKLSILWRRLFPARETMALLYPAPAHSWRIYPYYLVRFKDLLVRFGSEGWQLLRGDPQKKALIDRSMRARELHDWLKAS